MQFGHSLRSAIAFPSPVVNIHVEKLEKKNTQKRKNESARDRREMIGKKLHARVVGGVG